MIEILVKYLILEGCTPELRTHFLERKVRTLDDEEFQFLGVAFQAAHGWAKHVDFSVDRKNFGSASHEDDSSTMLAWKVEVKREAAELDKITKMSLKERRSYACEERWCFNCLRKGYPYWKCRNKKRCDTCGKKHQTLLHLDVEGEQKTRVHMISFLTETQTRTEVLLMTAAVQIIGENGRKFRTQAFLDRGAQVSFVAAKFVEEAGLPGVRRTRVAVQGFGTKTEKFNTSIHEVKVVDAHGSHHSIRAKKRSDLNLSIPPVPTKVVQRWRERGMEVSDANSTDSSEIWLLIGADYANQFLKEQRIVDGEVAWLCSFGWLLSRPCKMETAKQYASVVNEVKVSYVQNKVEPLWEMKEPHVHDNLPAFPLKKCDDMYMYEVGWLWQGQDRPEDNKRQAVSSAVSLRRGLMKKNNLESYEDVLMKEYQELEAIEKEPEPERPGYCMPHHAVVREARSINNKITSRLQCVSIEERWLFAEWCHWARSIASA